MKPTLNVSLIIYAVLMLAMPATAQDQTPTRESLVKSAMVYNFIRFIEWPGEAKKECDVCAYSGSVFANALKSIDGKPVGDASIKIRVLNDADAVDLCDVVVLSQSDEARFYTRDVSLDAVNVLTVGDSPNFARQGGVIGFTERDGRIGFEVNVGQADARGLTFSSRLLRLAEIVSNEGNGR